MLKGFSAVVLLIVFLAVAAGGYLVFQNQGLIPILPTNPSPSPIIQDETANWKTYTNTKYFYSLRFPHNWKVSNYEGNTESDLNVNTTHEIKFSPVIQVDNKVPQIRIGVGLGSETTTEEYLKNLDQLKKATSPREVNDTLGRVSAYRTIENSATLGKITTILVAKNRLRYQISSVSPNTDSQDEKIFDQILSTFKFTDQNSLNLSKTSPDDSYSVSETMVGDYNTIVVKNSSGKVVTNDLIKKNEKAIGYGTKFGCQCGTSFGGWIDGSHFVLKIGNGNGEEYQYTVDASTGLVNEASFKKVK